MLKFYVRFLRESLLIPIDQINFCILGNGIELEEIENYWRDILGLPQSAKRKSKVNIMPSSSQQKGRKLNFGVCHVNVNSTRFIQHVFGAIQEYTGLDKPEWLG